MASRTPWKRSSKCPRATLEKSSLIHLQPLEVQHQRSILAVTAFQFTESMVGAYDEVVLSVIVPPMIDPSRPLPKAAFFPFQVGVTTASSRRHAIERWHLPHYMHDLQMEFVRTEEELAISVRNGSAPVLDVVMTHFPPEPARVLFNAFTMNDGERYRVNIFLDGPHGEHEEETGSLTLYPHAMTEPLTLDDVSQVPFREHWFHGGIQTFEELERI